MVVLLVPEDEAPEVDPEVVVFEPVVVELLVPDVLPVFELVDVLVFPVVEVVLVVVPALVDVPVVLEAAPLVRLCAAELPSAPAPPPPHPINKAINAVEATAITDLDLEKLMAISRTIR